MKKFARIAVTVLVLALTLIGAVPTQASNLNAAQYMRSLTITNSGAETTNNAVVFDPSTSVMIANGLVNSSLTGTAVTDLANKDLVYMPASQSWVVYVPSVAANTSLNERFYISTNNLNSHIAYFPGTSGLYTNRTSALTLSGTDDWSFTIDGQSISGDGSYLFKYGSNLYALLNGNTITFGYGTITVPIGTYTHNTSWAYYWGTIGTGYTFTTNGTQTNLNNGTYLVASRQSTSVATNRYVALKTTLSNNPYNTMILRSWADSDNQTTQSYGYGTSSSTYDTVTSSTITNSNLLRMTIPTGSTIYPIIKSAYNAANKYYEVRAYMLAFAKADNPTQYSALTKYGSNASAMISNSTNMLNDLAACITLATKCTGDFMWQCVANSTFTTALNSSPYKSIITSSIDWAKALAWNTGSYTQTTPSGNTWTLSTTQDVPVGNHSYNFRKEGNTISIYVDNMLVRGGIFEETSYYNTLNSMNKTYSQTVSYTTQSTIEFAHGGAILFADEITMSKNSADVASWVWAFTDNQTFPDTTGNGNTGYPSFRVTNYGSVDSGANLSVSLGIYQPANVAQYDAPGGSEASTFTGLLPEIEQPEQDVDLGRIQNVPFASVFEDLLEAGGIPSQLFWLPIMMTFAIAACGVAYHLTRDALISCIAGDVMLGLGCALSILYTVPLVIGIVTTIVLLVKRKTISL